MTCLYHFEQEKGYITIYKHNTRDGTSKLFKKMAKSENKGTLDRLLSNILISKNRFLNQNIFILQMFIVSRLQSPPPPPSPPLSESALELSLPESEIYRFQNEFESEVLEVRVAACFFFLFQNPLKITK